MRKLVVSYAVVASLAAAAPALAQGVPAAFLQNQQSNVAVSRQTPADTVSRYQNVVPSYLLRKDGRLINGLLPTHPDAQG